MSKDNKSAKLYISDQTESNDIARRMGEVQVLECEKNDIESTREGDYENTGNKSAKYYKR